MEHELKEIRYTDWLGDRQGTSETWQEYLDAHPDIDGEAVTSEVVAKAVGEKLGELSFIQKYGEKNILTRALGSLKRLYKALRADKATGAAIGTTAKLGRMFETALGQMGEANISVDSKYSNAVNHDLLDFINSIENMKDEKAVNKRKFVIGAVSENHAKIIADVFRAELGKSVDASSYNIVIDGSAINHIEKRHGKNGETDHSMANNEDIARVGWAANNAESGHLARKNGKVDTSSQYRNSDGTPSPKIILKKSIGNNNYVVIECVPEAKSGQIHILSARITKGGNGQVLNMESKNSPQLTSKAPVDSIATTDSISQTAENVKSVDKKSKQKFDLTESQADKRKIDAEYLELAKDPQKNDKRLSEMVREAAEKAGYIHDYAVAEIDKLRKVYTPPVAMQEEWDKAHKEYVERVAVTRQMLTM